MQICVLSMNINENLVNTATCVLQPASLSPLGDRIRQVPLYIHIYITNTTKYKLQKVDSYRIATITQVVLKCTFAKSIATQLNTLGLSHLCIVN